jgi:hypothetical protein
MKRNSDSKFRRRNEEEEKEKTKEEKTGAIGSS